MDKKNESIGYRFRHLRKGLHLTQETTAEKLGVSLALYSRIENDHQEPSTHILIAAADLFAVSLDYLVGRSDVASNTGLCPEALQILTADNKDVQNRLYTRNEAHLVIDGYSAASEDFQSLATVLNFLLTSGRADRGSNGLLDLLRAYLTTPEDATIDEIPNGITAAGRRPVYLPTGKLLVNMYFSEIQQTLVQYRESILQKKRKKPRK